MQKNDKIPQIIQAILDKKKILEITENDQNKTWWFCPPDEYQMPDRIHAIIPNYEMHFVGKKPYLINYIKS